MTSASKKSTQNQIEELFSENFFDSVVAIEDVQNPKPDAELILTAI
ncbi:MAG: hypothetical protein Fur0024_3780 [Patescibacteria group bacterium]